MTVSIEEIIEHNIHLAKKYESRVRSLTAEYGTEGGPSWVYTDIKKSQTIEQRLYAITFCP